MKVDILVSCMGVWKGLLKYKVTFATWCFNC